MLGKPSSINHLAVGGSYFEANFKNSPTGRKSMTTNKKAVKILLLVFLTVFVVHLSLCDNETMLKCVFVLELSTINYYKINN